MRRVRFSGGPLLNISKDRIRSDNKSGHKGVFWDKIRHKWEAYITHNGERIRLGRFNNKQDAINARLKAEKKYFTHI